MEKSLAQLLEEIYSDSRVAPSEVIQLRKYFERAMIDLLNIDGDEGVTNALCKSFEVTNQLLQEALLKARRNKENKDFKNALEKVIESEIELMKANHAVFGK
jgi:hypothetical protein